jgi:hypothetical protein
VWTWIGATVVLAIGVGMAHTGRPLGDPIAAIGSMVILLDMLLFGWLVFRREATESGVRRASAVPAE